MQSNENIAEILPTNHTQSPSLNHPQIARKNHAVRMSAIFETMAFLSVISLVSFLTGDGTRFMNTSPHPFWIIIMLIVMQYGANEAIAAALLSSFFLLIGNLPEQSLTETMYEYLLRVLSLPFTWVITALILGGVRARQIKEQSSLKERLEKSERIINTISAGYSAIKHTKEQLELRLASEKCSLLTISNISRSLQTTDISKIPAAIARLVDVVLSPGKFSIFFLKDESLHLYKSFGWKKTDSYSTILPNNSPLAHHILNNLSPSLCVTNADDEPILMGEGIMAGPIIDKHTGKVFGMLKVEEMNFINMSGHTRETFQLLCEWISSVYMNVDREDLHDKQDASSIHNPLSQEKLYAA